MPVLIGPYHVLEEIGQGAMGVVYKAEQREPVRRLVALKVVQAGIATRELLARFQFERRALAAMSHRCIAKVLDAGTTEKGEPYFVMELVEGLPLTQYCDKHKLSIGERLRLFQQVCDGVQHAHLKGVIHRDLKPGNVLVVREGQQAMPKILDFGLAKAMNRNFLDLTIFTERDRILGTPEYMAPEQAAADGESIDARADIYSLGVILYELLSGELPFPSEMLRRVGMLEAMRVIQQEQPQKPSTKLGSQQPSETVAVQRRTSVAALKRELAGDLDWIVLKAMAKEPERRYDAATALASDVDRYLLDMPILAGPPGLGYRIRKFAKRYRTQVVAALLILSTALSGTAVAVAFAFDAAHERRRAERHATDASETAERAVKRQEAATLIAVQEALASGWVRRAHELLMTIEERGRASLEWKMLAARFLGPGSTLPSEGSPWTRAAWSPDGKRVALAAEDGRVSIRNGAPPFTELARLHAGEGWVDELSWSPKGAWIVALRREDLVIWRAAGRSSAIRKVVGPGGRFWSHDWSPTRDVLAVVEERFAGPLPRGRLSVLAPKDEGVVAIESSADLQHPATEVRWCPVGERLALVSAGCLCLFDPKTNAEEFLVGHEESAIVGIGWDAPGKNLYFAWGSNVLNEKTQLPICCVSVENARVDVIHPGFSQRLACLRRTASPCGLVAGFDDGSLQLLDSRAPQARNPLATAGGVLDLGVASTEGRVVSIHANGAAHFWSLEQASTPTSLELVLDRGRVGRFYDAASMSRPSWSPRGLLVSWPGHEGTQLWSRGAWPTFLSLLERVDQLAWSPTGHRVALAIESERVLVYDFERSLSEPALDLPKQGVQNETTLTSAAWSPHGDKILLRRESELRVVTLEPRVEEVHLPATDAVPESVAWLADNQTVAVVDDHGTVSLLGPRASAWRTCARAPGAHAALAAHATLPLLAATSGGDVLVIDVESDERIRFRAHEGELTGLDWHPTEPLLATCSESDRMLQLWRPFVLGKTSVLRVAANLHIPRNLEWSPDGATLACVEGIPKVQCRLNLWPRPSAAPAETDKPPWLEDRARLESWMSQGKTLLGTLRLLEARGLAGPALDDAHARLLALLLTKAVERLR